MGDVNANGRINTVNAQVAVDMYSGNWSTSAADVNYDKLLSELESSGVEWTEATLRKVADANEDLVINANDARAIQYHAIYGTYQQ